MNRWAWKFDRCINPDCTSQSPHHGHGLCRACYMKKRRGKPLADPIAGLAKALNKLLTPQKIGVRYEKGHMIFVQFGRIILDYEVKNV